MTPDLNSTNVLTGIERQAETDPDHQALVSDAIVMTYAELWQKVCCHAAKLGQLGLQPGERLALTMENRTDHLVWALAVIKAGACLIPLPPDATSSETEDYLRCSAAQGLLDLDQGNANLTLVSEVEDPLTETRFATLSSPPAIIRPTSGTTGAQKGVLLSHASVAGRIACANSVLGIGPDDIVLWTLPCAYHLAVSIFLYLNYGATILLAKDQSPDTLLELASIWPVATLYGTPWQYRLLAADVTDRNFPDLRWAISTGIFLPRSVALAFEKRFRHPVRQAYGVIEAGLVAINASDPPAPDDSVGQVVPGYEVTILDEFGSPVSDGEVGEVLIQGPGLFEGYVSPWLPREQIGFHPGDFGRYENGVLTLMGRKSCVLNVAGLKVFPEEVEAVLLEHPSVSKARVFGVPHQRSGDIVRGEVCLHIGENLEREELLALCRRHLACHKVPVSLKAVSDIPTTSSGKVQRRPLPYPAQLLVPHRPPMLIINQLLEKDKDTAVAEAVVPSKGIFVDPDKGLLPEYIIELVAQSMAAANGFDAKQSDQIPSRGFLVGIDNFSWMGKVCPGETLRVELKKTLKFQAVTIMEGRVVGPNGLVACGEIKVWEEKETANFHHLSTT